MNSLFWWTGALVWTSALVAAIAGLTIGYILFIGRDDLEGPRKRPDRRVPLDTLD